ncbi:hypothetical protein GUJ93_ZPchr0006g45346 [Zizania palustris]|uniref:Uncharacterized protein n=1 Tax=Zizania palustris TaxID=103762 RepID=A0A8J5ST83_ZIZPA|nr:hypothetical protein GUJ93_ZPchr0006g45346 [Zizania palustris]
MAGVALFSTRRFYYVSFIALLLRLPFVLPSQAIKVTVGGYGEEKVPLAVIVPDPSPEMRAPSPDLSAMPAPPPVSGAGDDDMRPRLPTERWRRGRAEERRSGHRAHAAAPGPSSSWGPARAPASASASAPTPTWASAAPDTARRSGTAFIRSSPAVPVPRGVKDTATILPMSAPGDKRQDVGAAAASSRAGVLPLVAGFIMMASFLASY